MVHDKKDGPEQRDSTMTRLVAAALESQTTVPSGDTCPDAEILAAYADRALSADETARWENHFADCARCQKVLAMVAVSAENPLTQKESARLDPLAGKTIATVESAAAAPQAEAPAKGPQIVKPVERPSPWRWLVPAFGVAAAVALWFALRPAPPGVAPDTQIMAQKSAVAPPPGQQEMAQSTLQPPQSAAPPAAKNAPVSAPSQEKEARSLDRENSSSPSPGANSLAVQQKDTLRDETSQEARGNGATNEDKKQVTSGAPSAEADRAGPVAPQPPRGTTQSVTVMEQAPAVAAGSGTAGAGAAAPPPPLAAPQAQAARQTPAPQPASPSSGQPSGERQLKLPFSSGNIAALNKVGPTVFSTPDGRVTWRIGAAGRIERSTDQGRAWQPQSSGVTADLLAGVAVSDKIAWIVGRANTILRTTDGEHWQRATPPALPPSSGAIAGRVDAIASSPDWSSVQASDELHATVVSTDGRRYATTDGGLTWKPQQ